VPDVLLSGNHAQIERWRRDQSLLRTHRRRPDLLDKFELNKKDREYLKKLEQEESEQTPTEDPPVNQG